MVIYQKIIKREDLRNNTDKVYIFGDNVRKYGLGGQAKEMRGEPNAYGIPTKVSPNIFYSDLDYFLNCLEIEKSISAIPNDKDIVFPYNGIGTGLADLKNKAPKTLEFLNIKLKELGIINDPEERH